MNSLLIRVLSALAAVTMMFLIFYFFEQQGLRVFSFLVIILGLFELGNILFIDEKLKKDRIVFILTAALMYLGLALFANQAMIIFAVSCLFYFSFILWRYRYLRNIRDIFALQTKGLLGLFYLGFLPTFPDRLLTLNHGSIWFAALLGIVFAGDTFAYIFGRLLGQRRIMPAVSPKKSVEGAFGGALGSLLAAGAFSWALPHVPILFLLVAGLVSGVIGQFGDFFESLLKREAEIKDSGAIMPGHGGVLDRIDGVLFASPIIYFVAITFETLPKPL